MPTRTVRNPRRVSTPVDHVLRALTSPEHQAAVGLTPAPSTDEVVQALEAAAPKARANTAMDRVNSQTLTVLESTWAAIRRRHKDLPPVAFTIGGSETTRGHFHAETWADNAESGFTRSEVFLAGERLKDGPREVLATLLHEAAHALAHVRGISDTSRGGRFHNAKFRDLGRELGLDVTQIKGIGWSGTTLTDEAADVYRVALDKLATVESFRRPLTRAAATGRKNNNNGVAIQCPTCQRKARMSGTALEVGPVVCWPCYEETGSLELATMTGDEDA